MLSSFLIPFLKYETIKHRIVWYRIEVISPLHPPWLNSSVSNMSSSFFHLLSPVLVPNQIPMSLNYTLYIYIYCMNYSLRLSMSVEYTCAYISILKTISLCQFISISILQLLLYTYVHIFMHCYIHAYIQLQLYNYNYIMPILTRSIVRLYYNYISTTYP